MIIGFAWGTIGAVSQHLTKMSTRGSVVLHLNGGVNNGKSDADCVGTRISRFGEAFGARRRFFSVLTFLDYVGTRCAMWLDRSIAPVLEMQRQVNIGLFSVGAVTGPCSLSRVLRTRRHPGLESAGGGDVCTVFLRADGMHEDLSLHERAASHDCILLLAEDGFTGAGWLTPLGNAVLDGVKEQSWAKRYGPILRMLYDIGFLGISIGTRRVPVFSTDDPNALRYDRQVEAVDGFVVARAYHSALEVQTADQRIGSNAPASSS